MKRSTTTTSAARSTPTLTTMILCLVVMVFAFVPLPDRTDHRHPASCTSSPTFAKHHQQPQASTTTATTMRPTSTTMTNDGDHDDDNDVPRCIYHENDNHIEYRTNPTPFGRILAGQLPARTYAETLALLCFRDKHPRARLHGLVIPKQLIATVNQLTPSDLPLLGDLKQMALQVLQEREPEALAKGDYRLCFHVPPWNSVDHLHLHVLAPVSQMSWVMKHIKYNCDMVWAISFDDLEQRLQQEQQQALQALR